MSTALQQLAAIKLGRAVPDYIDAHRAAGLSWQRIADNLRIDTDGAVIVSHETIRQWSRAAA